MITSYGYGTLCLKEGPNQPGPIFSTLFIYFVQFFSLINYSLRDPLYIRPRIFLFSRPHFATPLATPIRNSSSRLHSQLPFATHVRDSCSRLTFATPECTPSCDSLFPRLPHRATPPLTDGLCQHPSAISLAFQP